MSSRPIARVGDRVEGQCWAPSHSIRDFVGHWITGASTSTLDGKEIIRVGDVGITDCGHIFHATTGSSFGSCEGKPVHRVGDEVVVDEGGFGHTVEGSPVGTCL